MPDRQEPTVYTWRDDLIVGPGIVDPVVSEPFTFTVTSNAMKLVSATWRGDLENSEFQDQGLRCTVTYASAGRKLLRVKAMPQPDPPNPVDDAHIVFDVDLPSPAPPELPPFPEIDRLGTPDHYPDAAFLSTVSRAPDPFVRYAREFHRRWGIPLTEVTSLQQVVEELAGGSPGRRIRLMTHSDADGLFLPMFASSDPRTSSQGKLLDAFAESMLVGLGELAGRFVGLTPKLADALIQRISASEPAALAPFPEPFSSTVALLIERSLELGAIESRPPAKQPTPARALEQGLDAIIEEASEEIANGGGPTKAECLTLSRAIRATNHGPDPRTSLFNINRVCPADEEHSYVQNLDAALTAHREDFGSTLGTARQQLTGTSIDLRACRVGRGTLLRSVAKFFGVDTGRVSGPRWYQAFGTAPAEELFDDDPPRTRTASQRETVRAAVEYWAALTGIVAATDRRAAVDPRQAVPWRSLSSREKLSTYLHHARALAYTPNTKAARVICFRPQGGLPPQYRPQEAVELFLESQWDSAPTARVEAIRDEVLQQGEPLPVAMIRNFGRDDKLLPNSGPRKLTICPDPEYAKNFIANA